MHFDKKLGLALGVLLIGIVGAFFFRNEKDPSEQVPQLEDPQRLDDRIAEKPLIPYLTGVETDESTELAETSRTETIEDNQPLWELPDFLKGDETDVDNLARSAGPPNPINTVPDDRADTVGSGIPIPEHNKSWDVMEDNRDRPTATSQKRSKRFRVYRVRKGDTLSGLAARYLGSSSRFHDIFAANRNDLRNPNDLRVGMTIKIPIKSDPPTHSNSLSGTVLTDPEENSVFQNVSTNKNSAEAGEKTGPNSEENGSRTPAEKSARRFVPVRRPPLSPSRPENRSSKNVAPTSKTKRELSQVPPVDLPELEDLGFRELTDRNNASPSKEKSKAAGSRRRSYTVRRGDSLEKIALRFYGTRNAARKLFAANRDRLKNPDAIREGMTLILP